MKVILFKTSMFFSIVIKSINYNIYRLVALLSSNQIEIIQIRGSIQLIQSIPLLGVAYVNVYILIMKMSLKKYFEDHYPFQKIKKLSCIPNSDKFNIMYYAYLNH